MRAAALRTLSTATRLRPAHRGLAARCYSTDSLQKPSENTFLSYVSQFRKDYERAHPMLKVSGLKLVPVNDVQDNAKPVRTYPPVLPLVPLPDLPPRPSYPTPWLTQNEYNAYLKSLYGRMWRIYRHIVDGARIAYLGKHMVFVNSSYAEEYVGKLRVLMEKAVHHGHVEQVQNNVFYATNTHSAIPDANHAKEMPGVTLHDVRMALKAEKLWEEYLRDHKVLIPSGMRDSGVIVKSIRTYFYHKKKENAAVQEAVNDGSSGKEISSAGGDAVSPSATE